jgi:hypothetical protein
MRLADENRGRRFVLTMTFAGFCIALVAGARLAAMVWATPTAHLLMEDPRLVDTAIADDAAAAKRQLALTRWIDAPRLHVVALSSCLKLMSSVPDASGDGSKRCQGEIDATLRLMPMSSELWLFKAQLFFRQGQFAPMAEALTQSYRAAPREGWIAAGRVVLGLRVYALLPARLQDLVLEDLKMAIANPDLSTLLVQAYYSDFALRQSAKPVLERLNAQELEEFLHRVHAATG